MPNGLRIEHCCDITLKAQSWLDLNLLVFMFVYIHFNVPPTRITDLVRNVQMKRFIDMEQSPLSMFLLLLTWFVFCYTANEYSIYHFCIIIKDFFVSFSRVQDFETVTVYVLFVYMPTFSVIFC